jgi:hypothetical protein
MREFVEILGDGWFMFRYEDMVNNKFEALNAFLGFETAVNAEVPSGTGKEKVVRKKAKKINSTFFRLCLIEPNLLFH